MDTYEIKGGWDVMRTVIMPAPKAPAFRRHDGTVIRYLRVEPEGKPIRRDVTVTEQFDRLADI